MIGKKVLGFFHIIKQIGSGSFATVYLAEQEGTDRKAVVKIAHKHLVEGNQGDIIASRFSAEFKASTRIDHHNIVTVFAAGKTDEGLPVIAMEYVHGVQLRNLLHKYTPVRPSIIVSMITQLTSVIWSLHRSGIIHRDVTPNNIMVTRDKNTKQFIYKLLDFGIAQVDGIANNTSGPLGTPRYMAPEQMQGTASFRSDIYSLGAILWWTLTGKEYLSQIKKFSELFIYHIKKLPVLDPREMREDIPAPIAQLVCQMLNPIAELRPTSEQLTKVWSELTEGWLKTKKNGQETNNSVLSSQQPKTTTPKTPSPAMFQTSGFYKVSNTSSQNISLPQTTGSYQNVPLQQSIQPHSMHPPANNVQLQNHRVFLWNENAVLSSVIAKKLQTLGCHVILFESNEDFIQEIYTDSTWNTLITSDVVFHLPETVQALRATIKSPIDQKKIFLLSEEEKLSEQTLIPFSNITLVNPLRLNVIYRRVLGTEKYIKLSIDESQYLQTSLSESSIYKKLAKFNNDSKSEIIEKYMGTMPEWLADLGNAIESSNKTQSIEAAKNINFASISIGAEHIARLAQIIQEMGKENMFEETKGIFSELQNEYQKVFRELLSV